MVKSSSQHNNYSLGLSLHRHEEPILPRLKVLSYVLMKLLLCLLIKAFQYPLEVRLLGQQVIRSQK